LKRCAAERFWEEEAGGQYLEGWEEESGGLEFLLEQKRGLLGQPHLVSGEKGEGPPRVGEEGLDPSAALFGWSGNNWVGRRR